ncbi:MAG: bacillithiol system redox-active protein YtxJ [Blastocatellia bacterium]|nr:bacillithiol system redox-active protein YtxJ [Blastocatellia bacterium]
MSEYREITTSEELAAALRESEARSVLFFKHSNTCGISDRAFREYRNYLDSPESDRAAHYLITVQTAREVSRELARLTGIVHESPQAILVRNGKAVWSESHLALKKDLLAKAIS